MTSVAALRAEIALRYGGGGPEGFKPKPDRIRSVRRRQVLQLMKDRHGRHLPDMRLAGLSFSCSLSSD